MRSAGRPTEWTTEFPRCCPSGQSFDGANCLEKRCGTASDTPCSRSMDNCCRGQYCSSSYCTNSRGSKISEFTSSYGWHPSDASQWPLSREVSANCRPNPCRHNGTCTPTYSAFQCDCDSDPAFLPQLNCAFRCPPGRICSSRPLDNSTAYHSTPCPAGWFCSGGSDAVPTQPARRPQGRYCPEGSSAPRICPPGFECPDPQMAAPIACTRAGSVCVNGSASAVDCPAGYFCGSGHDQTVECPRGHYCPVRSEAPLPCPDGFLGSATGLNRSDCSGICPEGQFCPVGTGLSERCNWCPAGSAVMAPCPRDHECDLSIGVMNRCYEGFVSAEGSSHCELPACPLLQKREGSGDKGGCQLTPGGIALIVCMALLGVLVMSTLMCLRRRRRLRAAMEQRNKRTQVNVVGAAQAAERAAASGGSSGNGGGGASVGHASPPGGVDIGIGLRSPSHAAAAPHLQMAPLPAANSNSNWNSNWNSNRVSPSAPAHAHGRPLVLAFGAPSPNRLQPLPTVAAAPAASGIGGFPFAAPAAAAAAASPPAVRFHPEPEAQSPERQPSGEPSPRRGERRLLRAQLAPALDPHSLAQPSALPAPPTYARAPCTAADMPAFGSSGAEGQPWTATHGHEPTYGHEHGHSLGLDHDLATPPPYSSIAVGAGAGAPQGTEGQQAEAAAQPSSCASCGSALPPASPLPVRFCYVCGARLAS